MLVSATGILKYLKFTTRQDGYREELVRQVREAEQVVCFREPLQQSDEKWWNSQAFYTAGLMRLKEAGVQAWRVAEEIRSRPVGHAHSDKRRTGENRKRQRKGNTGQHWRIKQAAVVMDTTDCREKTPYMEIKSPLQC